MKVIGAGFGRTGTLSLKVALDQLGFGPTLHMTDLIGDPERVPLWHAAARGEAVDWTRVFAGWASTVDWPGCTFWTELCEIWRDTPVILTVRDPDAWYESCRNSIHEAKELALRGELRPPADSPGPPAEVLARFVEMVDDLIWKGTFGGRFLDKAHAVEVFRRHNEDVACGVPAERLLVWEAAEGWGPLCRFLGVEAPHTPFPHLNDTDSFRHMFGLPTLGAGSR